MLGFKELINKVSGLTILGDKEFNEILKELQRTLLRSDVSFSVVKQITENIKKRKETAVKGLSKKQQLITIIYEEITKIMGYESELTVTKTPYKIMLVGLFGSGKTTTSAKIGLHFKKQGRKIMLVGLDDYRPAAFEQLSQNAQKTGLNILGQKDLKKPEKFWKENIKTIEKNDVIIIDTAGRDSINKDYLKEIKNLEKTIKPDQILLVIPAELGQTSEKLTNDFNENVKITGIIITKTDTTAKAGGALTSSYLTQTPVYFITEGEKMTELTKFDSKRYVSKLLGFGDLQTLLEQVEQIQNKEEMEDAGRRMMKGKLTYDDYLMQVESLNQMGGVKKMLNMLPGIGALGKIDQSQLNMGAEKMKTFKVIIQSMTKQERAEPKLLNQSRIKRITMGSGRTEKEARELIKNFNQMSKMMKGMNEKNIMKMAKKFGMKL